MDKLQAIFKSNKTDTTPQAITERVLYRYRRQRGVNLGAWFVCERWIDDSPFREAAAPGASDLDIAKGSNAKSILEDHWNKWISEDDWKYIASKGINAVRLPIGYYHLCGADKSVIKDTDFAPYYDTFSGAWSRIQAAIQTAQKYSIGVLVDLHGAPGGQNKDAHAGTSHGVANFYNSSNQKKTAAILSVLSKQLKGYTNVIGIELLNEASPPNDKDLQSWYQSTVSAMRSIDPTMPIYVSDSWKTQTYADWINNSKVANPSQSLFVLDAHLYRCFTDQDAATSATAHAASFSDPNADIPKSYSSFSTSLGENNSGLLVGEWSGALNPKSFQGPGSTQDQQKAFVNAELGLFENDASGFFFWTYKKPGDTGWGWRDAVEHGVFPSWVGFKFDGSKNPVADANRRNSARDEAQKKAFDAHTTYWNAQSGKYDHARFTAGYLQGWNDATSFLLMPDRSNNGIVTVLGFRGAWRSIRKQENLNSQGKSQAEWEFDHGFDQGVDGAVDDFKTHYTK